MEDMITQWYVRVKFKEERDPGDPFEWDYRFCRTHPPFPSLHAAAEFARNLPNVKEWDVKELRVTPAEAGKMKRIQEFFAAYEEQGGA